ncbi:MAG: peptidoglycan-binding protein [Cyanobacteria bacterium P01_D01_bin.50]
MRRCHYPIVIFTYLTCCGFDINPTVAVGYEKTPFLLEIAQANTSDKTPRSNLGIGSTGEDVKVLQTQLKKLGYYDGTTNGEFGATTRIAVTKFQQDKSLLPDGIAGSRTRELLKTELAKHSSVISTPTPQPVSEPSKEKSSPNNLIQFGLIGLGVLAGGGVLFYIVKWLYSRKLNNAEIYLDEDTELVQPSRDKFANTTQEQQYLEDTDLIEPPARKIVNSNQEQGYIPNNGFDNLESTATPSQKLLPAAKTSRLARANIVDELIQDLESSNPTQRRKAIWELGQKGDSRAIQPLVEQMIHCDSQQRSLILAALAEIGTRTLKPMNRALAVSMQDESADVRKNAIRDLTRIYDMMAQISQMLAMAMEDEDPEVQQVAKYAISHMRRIPTLPSEEQEI